jgi:alpha,alpha-trehalase
LFACSSLTGFKKGQKQKSSSAPKAGIKILAMQIHELGKLFEVVQLQNILGDGKTFPDCIPKKALEEIQAEYLNTRTNPQFDLKKFIESSFTLPQVYSSDYKSDVTKSASEHIHLLWNVLTRKPDEAGGSLIPLPHPYIVPGGRFREIYYWDSYFTMLGLQASGRSDLIQHMVDNFAFLIDRIEYIPNGNRTYFFGRSQPPFFSLMVKLAGGENTLIRYLPSLEKEYQFWMKGKDSLSSTSNAIHRVVLMTDGSVLNRYWDEHDTPRPEAYKEDVELSHQSTQKPEDLFRHLRAAAESGWDFSSRWFKDATSFATIHTTDIIPIDLNCLLYHLEQTLAEAFSLSSDFAKAKEYELLASKRKQAIIDFCWNKEKKFFFDYDFVDQKQKEHFTLAASFALFFKIATEEQAHLTARLLEENFLKPGGMTTTLSFSGQQWDAPNGWAPLQWITFVGLKNYKHNEVANRLKINWTNTNLTVYQQSGKMTEKYDVWSETGEASGGEYPNQDGFGWTNGVFLALTKSAF